MTLVLLIKATKETSCKALTRLARRRAEGSNNLRRPGEPSRPCTSLRREIIDLVYYHEKSVDDAAQVLGIPPATVKTRMFYARKELAELVQQAA
jgi:hypothetical protein